MILRILVLSILLPTASAFCQNHPAYTDAFHTGADEYQLWAGYSPDSITWIGKSEARRLFMAGGGWRRVLLAGNSVAWKFTMDAVPIALVSQPTLFGSEIVQDPQKQIAACKAAGVTCAFGRRTTYGVGFAPIGFEFNFRRKSRVQLVTGINAGLLRFSREVPVPNSASINFTFGLGAGLQIFTSASRSVTIGYHYHHISNADSGTPFNPGIDSNFIYAGYSLHR